LANLATLKAAQGAHAEAEQLYLRASEIRERGRSASIMQ
jgi:hypothetical protein